MPSGVIYRNHARYVFPLTWGSLQHSTASSHSTYVQGEAVKPMQTHISRLFSFFIAKKTQATWVYWHEMLFIALHQHNTCALEPPNC